MTPFPRPYSVHLTAEDWRLAVRIGTERGEKRSREYRGTAKDRGHEQNVRGFVVSAIGELAAFRAVPLGCPCTASLFSDEPQKDGDGDLVVGGVPVEVKSQFAGGWDTLRLAAAKPLSVNEKSFINGKAPLYLGTIIREETRCVVISRAFPRDVVGTWERHPGKTYPPAPYFLRRLDSFFREHCR